jgi:dUTP pyrophosphatase
LHNTTFAAMQNVDVKIINKSSNPLPQYATIGSSGMDIRAFIDKDIVLAPLQRALINTGLYIELPMGYEAQIRPRSGLAINQGITCLNTPGTIDADYRGEIKVILINLSDQFVTICNTNRIAQMVIQPVIHANLIEVNSITETARNEGGFGHTGKH